MSCMRFLFVTLMSLGLLPLEARAQQMWPTRSADPRQNFLYPQAVAPTPSPRGPLTITTPVIPQTNAASANPSITMPAHPAQQTGLPSGQLTNSSAMTDGVTSQDDQPSEQRTNPEQLAVQQGRPSNQMLQNPSGAYNLSHAGIVTGQQIAPNLYFGQQYHAWSNLRNPSEMPASFGEMPRFQPPPFNGYVAPNTYAGSRFSNWSNLSPGVVTPHPFGGWNYSAGQ